MPHGAAQEKPWRGQIPSPDPAAPPPLRAAQQSSCAAQSFLFPQPELVLGGQTALQAVFPPPRVRRRENSPNPRGLAGLMLSAGARWCCLNHIPPGILGFPCLTELFPCSCIPLAFREAWMPFPHRAAFISSLLLSSALVSHLERQSQHLNTAAATPEGLGVE